ncbi:MAG: hypothetical protein QW228_05775 [Candidatus Aenigmatarchaeota archaeon]
MPVLVEINSFSGGINRKVSPLLAKLDEGYTARNVRMTKIGAIVKRKGYKLIGNIPDSNPVRFLYPYYKTGASPLRQLLRISGTKFYYLNETNNQWVDATGSVSIDSTKIPDATTYANLAIIVNAASSVLKWDGSTLANLGGSPPNGTTIATFKDRVYIASGSVVYYSDVANPESWPVSNKFNVGLNDGDEITAVKPYFNSLLIFKKNSIWQYDVDEENKPLSLRPLAYGIGTESWRTIWIVNGVMHFTSRKGIYQFSGRAPMKISFRVEDLFENISNPENFVGWEDGDMYHVYIGDVDGRQNVVLAYDTVLDYFVYDDNLDVKSATTFINKDGILRQYFGDSQGRVWLLWEGYADADDGTSSKEIEMEYESHLFQIGEPGSPVEFDAVGWRMSHNAVSPATIEVSVDNSDWKRVGIMEAAIGKDKGLARVAAQAMDIKFRIHEISKKKGPEIYQIVFYGTMPQESKLLPKKYTRK